MPESLAKPLLTGNIPTDPTPWLPTACLLILLLPVLIAWPATTRATDPDEVKLRELLQREFSPDYELARLAVEDAVLSEKKGGVELSFTLRQKQSPPISLEVPLLIITPHRSFTTTLASNQAETPVNLELNDRPTEIILDPYQELPRYLSPAEIPPTWAGFLAADQRLAIVPHKSPEPWKPLLALLDKHNIAARPLAKIEDRELATASLLFIGSEKDHPARGFFAADHHGADRIELNVRENPLNREQLAVLLDLGSKPAAADLELLRARLDSPGHFSQLRIDNGEIRQQKMDPAPPGLRVQLDRPPVGMAASASQGFHEIMAELADTRVVYVGEVHNRYEDHLLQLRVLRAMYRQDPKLAVGMEMFPVSAQPALDAFVAGEIDEPEFLRQSDYFTNWSFDYRLYRDIIDFARRYQLPIIALNLERGITSKVFREGGISALSSEELEQIPGDRDLALPDFHQRISEAFTMHDHDLENEQERFSGFLQAQSLWDEQMASRIAGFLEDNPEHRLLAVVGRGHSDRRNAIPPRLARRLPVEQKVILPMRDHSAPTKAADYFFFVPQQSLPDQALLGVRIRDGAEKTPGALVVGLSPHGKAQEVGIQEDDLVIALDDWEVASANDLRIAMLYKKPGETVNVRVLRPATKEVEEEGEKTEQKTFESLEFTLEL